MSLHAHIGELQAKHDALKGDIEAELTHLSADDLHIVELKREKLRLKDEIARLKAASEAA